MKKLGLYILLLATGLFAAFTLGFFTGRNADRQTIQFEVPTLSTPYTEPETTAPPAVIFPIDLNTATREELMALPGIGEVFAQRILTYREKNGPFTSLDELGNVPGIGPARLEELKDYLITGGQTP